MSAADAKGKIDAETAKKLLADHYDEACLTPGCCLRTLCGHGESDSVGIQSRMGSILSVGAVQAR